MRRLQTAWVPAIIPAHMVVSNVFGGRFLAVPAWAAVHIAKYGQPRDIQVLVGLVSFMDVRTKLVDVSISKIAEEVGSSKETVKRSLKWLSDSGVIDVVERPRPSNNIYKVYYTQRVMGSPMTLYGVTHDPINGSPMTPLDGGNEVTHDPIEMPEIAEIPLFQEVPQITRIISNRDIQKEVLKRVASDDGKVVDMILGSDPERVPDSETPKPKRKKPRFRIRQQEYKQRKPEVDSLVSYFIHNKKILMTHTLTEQDRQIVRKTIRLLLDGGLTNVTIRLMMEKFFSNDNFIQAESPVLMFASQKVQKMLMDAVGIQLDTYTDPVLMFMVNDFNRDDLSLPWEVSSDETLREAIIMHGMEICYRYPEVVADMVRMYADDFGNPSFIKSLDALNALVRWHTGDEAGNPADLRCFIPSITLPKELLSDKKSKIRPASSTIATAVYTYRRITR